MRGFLVYWPGLLARRANAEEFELVCHGLESALGSYFLLELSGKALVNFNHFRATRANQVMMMAIIAFPQQFEPGNPIAEVETFHHFHGFEHPHRTVNSRQIAIATRQARKDFTR